MGEGHAVSNRRYSEKGFLNFLIIYKLIKYRSINRIRYTFIIFYLYPYLIRQTAIRQIYLYYVLIIIYIVLLIVPSVYN